jgi:protease I
MNELRGKTIAFVATDGVEQVELTAPRERLEKAGAKTVLISLRKGRIRGFKHQDRGDDFDVDLSIAEAQARSFDAVVLPGGVMNPDALRVVPEVQSFLRDFAAAHKPIAAICHGPWTLIDAGLVRGRRMTSWPSLRTDLTNAGAQWEDAECILDDGIITSRKPDDIPTFCDAIIKTLTLGADPRRVAAALGDVA